jgi:MoxR-like ATPase
VEDLGRVKTALRARIVGQDAVIDGVLMCVVAGGNVLLEGVPGLGKTLLVRTLAEALDLSFARIQFTPDLMPADILGTTVIVEGSRGDKNFEFRPGPVFSNVVLADEINRATPKTQSALLEAMQEHAVTVGGKTRPIPEPYFVLATQNPLEMEGTYPLPEAQLDRFLMKLEVPFPSRAELHEILERTTKDAPSAVPKVIDGPRLLELRALAAQVAVPRHVQDYVVRLVEATHPERSEIEPVKKYVRFGASPRGAQACLVAAKIRALVGGRYAATSQDVQAVMHACLRHRLILGFEGEAERIRLDDVLDQVVKATPLEDEKAKKK